MKQFSALTKYISVIEKDGIGYWHIDSENDGTPEHPIQFPFVVFSEMVHQFVEDVYALVDKYPKWELNHYGQILEQNGLKWESKSMSGAIVEDLDARCICAMLIGAVRAERFCDGALKEFFDNGSISRWLKRLAEMDEEQGVPLKRIQITSDGVCYGPTPESDEEVEQRLVIHRDGRVWFTAYNFGSGIQYAKGRKKQFKIPKDNMERLFVVFEKYFENDPHAELACDAGLWEAVMTDVNGENTKFIGSMVGDYEMDGINLSDLAREILRIDNLWIFGRNFDM